MKKIRLLIIEDNKLQRDGIRAMLKEQEDIEVVAALGDRVQVLDKIHDLKPDVLLLDIGLPNHNILNLVITLKKKIPSTKIIIMGFVPVQAEINKYMNAGVKGYIVKDSATDDFINTIRKVASGKKALPQIMTGSIFSRIVEDEVNELKASKLIQSLSMTGQEKKVVRLVAGGMTDKEIALKLRVSEYTIKSQVDNILEKMALNTRIQISIYLNSDENISGDGASSKERRKE